MKLRALLHILICFTMLFPVGAIPVNADTVAHPVSVAVPATVNGEVDTKPVSVAIPEVVNGQIGSKPVSIAIPLAAESGTYMARPMTLSVQPEHLGDPDLVGLWHMDGDWTDSSGNNLHGAPVNGVTFSTDKRLGTQSGSFDGSNDYVVVGNLYGKFSNNTFTIEAWVKLDSTASGARRVFAGGIGQNSDYGIGLIDNQLMVYTGNHVSTLTYARSGVIPTVGAEAPWYHVVGTYDGSTLSIYVDGQLKNTLPAAWVQATSGADFWIGGEYCCSGSRVDGLIDEVAIYKRAFTAEEIAVHANAGLADPAAPPAPVLDPMPSIVGTSSITLSGSKAIGTSIWVNSKKIAPLDNATTWQGTYGTLQPGTTILYVTAVDATYKVSPTVFATVIYDNMPPVIESSYPANNSNTAKPVTAVTINLTDNKSAINLSGSLEGATVKNSASQPVSGTWMTSGAKTIIFTPTASLPADTYLVTIYPVDAVGNRGQQQIAFTNHDTSAPTTTVSLNGTKGSDGWYYSSATVALTADDGAEGSGISKIEYSLDGTTWQTYSTPFVMNNDGVITLYFRSTDLIGNVESPAKTKDIKINKTALVGLWHMDNNWQDASLAGNHGSLSSTATFTSNAKIGTYAGSFNGSNTYVTIPDSPTLHADRNLTIMGWIYVNSLSSTWQNIIWKGNTPDCTTNCDGREYSFWVNTTGYLQLSSTPENRIGTGQITLNTPSGIIKTAAETPTNNGWYHVAGVISSDQNIMKIYVNGVMQANGFYSTSNFRDTSGPLQIGAGPGPSNVLNGSIDELSIYKRVLTDQEIQENYRSYTIGMPTVDPVSSPTTSTSVTLSGTKPANTAIVINGNTIVPLDAATTWQAPYTLSSGMNNLNISAMDVDGFHSQAVVVSVALDDTPPVVSSTNPVNNGVFNAIVSSLTFTIAEAFSAIDFTATLNNATVRSASGSDVAGSWTTTEPGASGAVTFTPSSSLTEGTYTATITPTDTFGNQGTYTLTFTVDLTPPQAPTIDPILVPSRTTTKTITGTKSSDSTRVVVTCSGATVGTVSYPTALTWSVVVSGLHEGSNTITAYAVDAATNPSASTQMTFIVDTVPPAVPIVNPPVTPTKINAVTLSGTKESGSYLIVNNVQTNVPLIDTTWTYPATLAGEGANTFVFFAKDEAGNPSATVPITIVRDTTAPRILSSVPAINGSVNQLSTLDILLIDDNSSVDLQASMNGAAVKNASNAMITGTWAAQTGHMIFTPSAAMPEGAYTVSLSPVDVLGNTTSLTFSFTIDLGPPTVQSLTMTPLSPHKAEAVTFSFAFSEDMTTTVQPVVTFTRGLLYSTYSVTGNWANSKTWQGTYTFSAGTGDGTYTVTVSGAKDKASNTMAEAVAGTFVLDTTPPSAPGLNPVISPTNNRNQLLTGTKEAGTAIYINNNQRVPADATTAWSYSYPLAENTNNLSITARDAAGNDSAPTTATIVLDTTAPVFTVGAYQNPSSSSSQTLTGTKESGCTVKLNGTQIIGSSDTSSTWSYTVSLTSGITNHFVFIATDAVGNTTTKTVNILYDSAPPAALSPGVLVADGSGRGSEVTLSWPAYPETADIAYYAVYRSLTSFTDVTGMTPIGTVNKGTRIYKATGLAAGTTYYFAVVAVDLAGNQVSIVSTVTVSPNDTMAPEDVTGLAATAGYTTGQGNYITLTWTGSINSAGDLSDQVVYVDSGTGYDSGTSLGKTAVTYTKTSLNDAATYKFKITVKDTSGHESAGTIIQAATRLANPANLTATPQSARAILTWSAVSSPYLKAYRVYRAISNTPKTDISQMTFVSQLGTQNSQLGTYTDTGLMNDTTYQYAVTTVNTFGAERTDVQSISLTPRSDTAGPVIDSVSIIANQVVTAPITITGAAHDIESAMGTMELSIDGAVVATQPGSSISYYWNTVATTDGNHAIKFKATDSLGNATEDTRTVIVSLGAPAMPAILSHLVTQTTPTYTISASGTAPLFTTVTLKVNGVVVNTTQTVGTTGTSGTFSFMNIALTEGGNVLSAKASHRGGESKYTPDYKVQVDTGAPSAPANLAGQLLPGGLIRFTWTNGAGELPASYNLYMGTSAFTTTAGATKTNTTPITYQYKEHNPGDDNLKYYAVTAVDGAGNESPISNVISMASDRLAPSITNIQYTLTPEPGPTAPASTTGIGTVKVVLTVSEALKDLPFLSFEPTAGSPILPTMTKVDDTHYTGSFIITADTAHGVTTYKYSAKDIVGNRGNAQGSGITIDVKGPVASIQTPQTVLQLTQTLVPVQVAFDEPVVGTPTLSLKASDNSTALLTGLTTTDNGIHWSGRVDVSALPIGQAEFLLSEAKDAFNNTGATVSTGKTILLYQNTVPPPAVPENLAASSDKGGKILLTWQPVVYPGITTATVTYNLYRRAEGETTPNKIQTGITEPQTNTVTAQDIPDQDGNYYYTVTSVGLLGSESPVSAEVAAISDRTGPGAPTNLTLNLTGNGVAATWTAPANEPSAMSYKLYRSASPITTTTGLTPVATSPAATTATDPGPSKAYTYYAVIALDSLGNESALSESVHISFPMAPVRNLALTRIEQAAPQISWDAPADGSAVGYYLYRNDSRIFDTAITDRAYTDGYYTSGGVTYAVTAVDSQGNESPKKTVFLPELSIGIKDNTTLRRGLLETATIIITNSSQSPVTIDSLDIKVGDATQSTLPGPLDIAANGHLQVEKILATTINAPSTVGVLVTATWSPAPGTLVKVYKTTTASVAGASTAFEIYSDPLVRGTQANVKIKVNNLGTAQMEIPTSENNGATTKVKINLKDEDGNVLATGQLNQRTGPVVNIGTAAVARINPAESFTSDAVTFTVPASAPYNVTIEAVITNTYYHYTKPDQVTAPGMTQTIAAPITDTSYRAMAAPEKTFYASAQPVLITGRAISNQQTGTEILMPFVPVKIGISTKGFDKYDTVTTDSAGNFSYTYTPGPNEAGTYQVWASHPDVSTRSIQAAFTIAGLQIQPSLVNWRMLKNGTADIPVKLTNTGGVQLVNLLFNVQASQGITAGVINSGGTAIAANETRTFTLRISADATAPDTGHVSLTATLQPAGQSGELLAHSDVNVSLVTAIPIITTSPSYIDMGMVRADQKIAQFTITNTGAASLTNAKLSAPSTSWMTLVTGDTIAELKPGASTTIGILLRPPDMLAQAIYDDQLVITSDNHIPYTFHIQITVTSNAVGNVLFDVLDQLMQRVENATIVFQHQTLTELMYTVKTAADGTIMKTDIPEGRYVYNISAPGHKSTAGSFIVSPGITTSVPIGMEVTLVEVEWSVVPVVIQDRYEITITQTFQTNVPAPVLITEPPVVNLPDMQPGEVYNGEFTVTNYGLVAVNNVKLNFPTSFQDYDIEVLSGAMPEKIAAMQKITVQYRITKRQVVGNLEWGTASQYALNSELLTPNSTLFNEVQGYGGMCVTSTAITTCGEAIICPNTLQQTTIQVCTSHTFGVPISCPGGSGGTGGSGGGGGGYVSGGGGGTGSQGGGGSLPGGSPTPLPNELCITPQPCPDKCCDLGGGGSGGGGGGGGSGGGPDGPPLF